MSARIGLCLTLIPLFLTACASSDVDKIHDAQACLDKSSSATAMTCYNQVSGINSTSASLIRCASILVYEGFGNPATLQAAVNNSQGGTASLTATMDVLRFYAGSSSTTASSAADLSEATDAANQCSNSGSTGLSMLASLASLATAASNLAAISTSNPSVGQVNSNAAAIVAAVPSTPQLLQTAYQQNCSGTISSSNQSYCTQYSAAQNQGGSASAIATYFLAHLN